MMLPGLISLAFYKRRPTGAQVGIGLVATIALSALLGYVAPPGALGTQAASVIVAIIGGVLLYLVILVLLIYWYQPRHAGTEAAASTGAPPHS